MNGFKQVFLSVVGVVLVASTSSVYAQGTCNQDSFETPDFIACGQQSFEKVDAALNEQYKKALGSLLPENKQLLIDVQRNWVTFKETYCEEVYLSASSGEEAQLKKLSCLLHATNARLGELIYLQTGMTNDGLYKAASIMAGKDRADKLQDSIKRLSGADLSDPVWKHYAAGNCDLSFVLFREDSDICAARMRFQLPLIR
ncbi:lysozyme inhibitor LprI family protein [Pseudomonas fluorescens]|uniref:lysozyme inhibitor LprI family protein n=1 Tax=Pseudomonas TaxID=286 RepID=UPI003CFEEE52